MEVEAVRVGVRDKAGLPPLSPQRKLAVLAQPPDGMPDPKPVALGVNGIKTLTRSSQREGDGGQKHVEEQGDGPQRALSITRYPFQGTPTQDSHEGTSKEIGLVEEGAGGLVRDVGGAGSVAGARLGALPEGLERDDVADQLGRGDHTSQSLTSTPDTRVQEGRGQEGHRIGLGGDGDGDVDQDRGEWVVKVQELFPKSTTHTPSAVGGAEVRGGDVVYGQRSRVVSLSIQEEHIPPDATPILVFVNPRSGGKQGANLLQMFRSILNPLQA
ncbi:unnamed protein product [Discosporangium mesarthrocarpum]